jgi:hypothetical protein
LRIEQDNGAPRGLQAQGQQSQTGRFEVHLAGASKEGPAALGNLKSFERGLKTRKYRIHTPVIAPGLWTVKILAVV